MPRRIIKRVVPASEVAKPDDISRKQMLFNISGWKESEIDCFLQDSILPKDRTPNVAFFSILIQKIVESDTLHLPHELPLFVQKLGLCVPDKLSSFRRFVSRHTDKAFVKGHFTELSVIPAPLQPKPSLIGPLCEDAGISENWLFNSEDVYTGQATITIGLLLELILVKKAKGVSDIQCSVWVQRLFHLQYLPHPGTIRRQWERISVHVSNLRGMIKKKERDDYLHLPYLPPSKSVQTSVPEKENEKTGYEKANDNVPSNDSATTREMVDQDTQCSSFPTLIELASIAFKRSAVVNEMDIRNIENQFELGKMQLTVLQEQPKPKKKKVEKKPEKKPEKKSSKSSGGDNMFQLSRMRYATVSEFRGKVMVGIREYYEADGDLRPGKKGISLTLEQWNSLKDQMEDIDEAIKDLQ